MIGGFLKFLVALPKWILLAPLRFLNMIRGSATVGSVTMLLMVLMSLNIVWGYPWIGFFSVCIAVLLVTSAVNRALRPNLELDFSLPRSVSVGSHCKITTHAKNMNYMPAFDVSVGFNARSRRIQWRKPSWFDSTRGSLFEYIARGETVSADADVVFHKRGILQIPRVYVTSAFPFHIFHSTQKIDTETTIAVTPAPLHESEGRDAQLLLSAVGAWAQKILSGDALQYIGSREYQSGMSVRRWDFASWARLGKPIVREFQSPSIQTVRIIVDAASQDKERFERLLRLAATAIESLSFSSIQLELAITCESQVRNHSGRERGGKKQLDSESMLVRLAAAETVDEKVSDQRLLEIAESGTKSATLLLTARENVDVIDLAGIKWECVIVDAVDQADSNQRIDNGHPVAESSSAKAERIHQGAI